MENIKLKINEIRKKEIFKIGLIIILSGLLTSISLYYSVGLFGREMFFSYFSNGLIILLNFLPALWLMMLIYMMTKKVSGSFIVTTCIYFGITLVNYFKIQLRNDSLLIEDVTLIKEALKIKNNYTFHFSKSMIIVIIFFILLSIFLYVFIDKNKEKKKIDKKEIITRVIGSISIFVVGIIFLNTIYVSNNIYNKTKNEANINKWSQTQQYISRGTMYPFLYSYTGVKNKIPEGYNKEKAKEQLFKYEYSSMPDDKKVNVISIMLEAYNDFSKFEEVEFTKNPYESLYKIKEESVSGELVTNIFAGGTVDTERKFLTGYTTLPNFRTNTNSYARYFQEQGYYTNGAHPGYDWFYNRVNVNRNLGFSDYYFFENRYGYLAGGIIAGDHMFIPDLLDLYRYRDTSKPYFNFSVTYQNHGPYGTENYYGKQYIKRKENYKDEECNILDNYFWGIENTSDELLKMINELREDKEPVVVIFFGDHNPWLGDNNSVYETLGINLNLDTEEGMYNYYCTPYVIWANDKAKEVLENDFIGQGEKIGPYFLMNKFFELAGYEGNEFMKASNELKSTITVVNDNFYVVNGEIKRDLSDDEAKKLNEFQRMEYYWKSNYKE